MTCCVVVCPSLRLLCLAFDTYLRPSRVCTLTADGPTMSFPPSKVGEFNDSLVVGSPGREWIGASLGRIYTQHVKLSGCALFPLSLAQFETQFKNSV